MSSRQQDIGPRRQTRLRIVAIAACLAILPASLLGLAAGCGESSSRRDASSPAASGTLDLLLLNRLRGQVESIPCQPGDIAALPAAARLRDELRAAGAGSALLAIVGDTLPLPEEERLPDVPALKAVAEARWQVHLATVAAARPDVWVPGHADLLMGADQLLDAARESGIPVLLSNVVAPARPELLRHLIVEAGSLRIGLLGVLAPRVADPEAVARGLRRDEAIIDATYPGLSVLPIGETVKALAAELRDEHGVEVVLLLSTLASGPNNELAMGQDLTLIVGGAELALGADRIHIVRDRVAVMSSLSGGRQVGHLTLHVENGSPAFQDLSPRYSLPARIEERQNRIRELMQQFGTTDIVELARRASPADPGAMIDQVELIAADLDFLAGLNDTQGSTIEWRAGELSPVPAGHPVVRASAGIVGALETALSRPDLPAVVAGDLERSLIPPPAACVSCHATQFRFWESTAHARAAERLDEHQRGRDPSCLSCHAAGFAEPAGWFDPRLDAPLGGVSCWQCHQASSLHSATPRLVVDPLHVQGTVEAIRCGRCHTDTRSPGFDRAAVLASVSCPPMRSDEPALALARHGALEAIALRRAEGRADARDTYLEGRALLGLGRVGEGRVALSQAARSNASDARMAVEISRLLDEVRESTLAQTLLEEFLVRAPAELDATRVYLELMLSPRNPGAARPAEAAAYLDLLLPKTPEESRRAMVDLRVLQVDAYFGAGRIAEARMLLEAMIRDHRDDLRVQALAARHAHVPR